MSASIIAVDRGSNRLLASGNTEYSFTFNGKGFVVKGGAGKLENSFEDMDLAIEVYIDGELYEEALLPTKFQTRRHDITWKYGLEEDDHEVRIVWKNSVDGYRIDIQKIIVYGPES